LNQQLNSQRLKPYTFAIRTSQRSSQKLQKSMSLPTLTDGRKKSTTAQQWLYVMRAKVLK